MLKYFALFLLLNIAFIHCLDENSYFANSADLDGDNYRLDWNYTDTEITFKVTAKTSGWVGFGLSPDGNMDGSDVVVAWTKSDGNVAFLDASLVGRAVVADQTQNWMKLFYSKKNAVSTMIFRRKLKVSDLTAVGGENNIDVVESNMVIYAWGSLNPINDEPTYHLLNRGSKSVALSEKIVVPPTMPSIWDQLFSFIKHFFNLFGF